MVDGTKDGTVVKDKVLKDVKINSETGIAKGIQRTVNRSNQKEKVSDKDDKLEAVPGKDLLTRSPPKTVLDEVKDLKDPVQEAPYSRSIRVGTSSEEGITSDRTTAPNDASEEEAMPGTIGSWRFLVPGIRILDPDDIFQVWNKPVKGKDMLVHDILDGEERVSIDGSGTDNFRIDTVKDHPCSKA